MPNFVALLRGINVGTAKRVSMAELRKTLEGLGYEDVATLLNSGNVVFKADRASPAKLAAAIRSAIEKRFGIAVPVIVKSASEFSRVVEGDPFIGKDVNHSLVLVAFAQDAKGLSSLKEIAPLATSPDTFVMKESAAYLHVPRGSMKSKAAVALLGKPGRTATTRNWATTLKLKALLERMGK